MLLFLLVVLGTLAVVAAIFIFDLLRGKGEFGLDVDVEPCSKCGFRVPLNGDPDRMQESGVSVRWVCPVCGEKTKSLRGKGLPAPAEAPSGAVSEDLKLEHFEDPLDDSGKTPVERLLHEKDDQDK